MFGFANRKRKREELRATPMPDEWVGHVRKRARIYNVLPKWDQEELLGHAQVILAEKRFEGCKGLEPTDEIRVTISALAALLIMHRETNYFRKLDTILVYPSTYVAPASEPLGAGVVLEGMEPRVGESWRSGVVVVSWGDIVSRSAIREGRNVVLHEFAHQLDYEDGGADGAPELETPAQARAWSSVLGREFEKLRRAADRGEATTIDDYGAKNPAEFFAVVTEAFFERPRSLRSRHPELYGLFAEYYRLDTAALPPWGERFPVREDPAT